MSFCFKQDQDSHWYLIPVKLSDQFDHIAEVAYSTDNFKKFDELFEEFRSERPTYYKFDTIKSLDDKS